MKASGGLEYGSIRWLPGDAVKADSVESFGEKDGTKA
jgi:hypothetical protein